MEYAILALCLIIFMVYNGMVIKKYGIPESISSTTYMLGNYYWIFTLMCYSTTFMLLPLWLNIHSDQYEILKFLSMASLLFVGSTPFFREALQKEVHYTSAMMCFISVVLWFILEKYYTHLVVCLILFLASLFYDKKKYCYFAEVIIWMLIIVYLLIEYLHL